MLDTTHVRYFWSLCGILSMQVVSKLTCYVFTRDSKLYAKVEEVVLAIQLGSS